MFQEASKNVDQNGFPCNWLQVHASKEASASASASVLPTANVSSTEESPSTSRDTASMLVPNISLRTGSDVSEAAKEPSPITEVIIEEQPMDVEIVAQPSAKEHAAKESRKEGPEEQSQSKEKSKSPKKSKKKKKKKKDSKHGDEERTHKSRSKCM